MVRDKKGVPPSINNFFKNKEKLFKNFYIKNIKIVSGVTYAIRDAFYSQTLRDLCDEYRLDSLYAQSTWILIRDREVLVELFLQEYLDPYLSLWGMRRYRHFKKEISLIAATIRTSKARKLALGWSKIYTHKLMKLHGNINLFGNHIIPNLYTHARPTAICHGRSGPARIRNRVFKPKEKPWRSRFPIM